MIVPLGSKKLQKKDLIKSRAKKLLNLQIISNVFELNSK